VPTRRAVTLPLVEPIVPVLRDQPFDDPAYLFEPKYDGFRGLLYLGTRECHFRSKRSIFLKQFDELCSRLDAGPSMPSPPPFSLMLSRVTLGFAAAANMPGAGAAFWTGRR
jgi:hypothetical protein